MTSAIHPTAKSFKKETVIINKFANLVRKRKLKAANQINYRELISAIKQIAEVDNNTNAQYYLANYYLLNDDISNYKFWLMRAARNGNPHPLANIKVVHISLNMYHKLRVQNAEQATTHLTTALRHLQFIMDYPIEPLDTRFDWFYAKEQAEKIWQEKFTEASVAMEIWSLPEKCEPTANYSTSQLVKLAENIKKLRYKIKELCEN